MKMHGNELFKNSQQINHLTILSCTICTVLIDGCGLVSKKSQLLKSLETGMFFLVKSVL